MKNAVNSQFLALAIGIAGCAQPPGSTGDVVVTSAATTPIPGASVLGFEVREGWNVSSGAVALSTTAHTQAAAALAVTAPQNYTTLVSVPMPSGLAPLAGLTDAGATMQLDLQLPVSQPNPSYFGAVQLYISVPSKGVNNQYLGQNELTGQQLGTFQTYQFAVTDFVRTRLAGQTYSDLTFTVALNAPAGARGTYIFDNLRVTSPATSPIGSVDSVDLTASITQSPATNTPGAVAFAAGTIQLPASFHVKVGSAGTGTALFEAGVGGVTAPASVSCSYAASSDKRSYVFSSCTNNRNVAGDIVPASFARLKLNAADPAAPLTKVKAQLARNLLGDQVGSKLSPPVPTFWGETQAEVQTITQAFAQAQVATLPVPARRRLSLPIPDFAQSNGDGAPLNVLDGAAPRPPNDPPFLFRGDLNNSADGRPTGMFDAYYELGGSVSGADAGGQTFASHFDATAKVGVVVLYLPVDALVVHAAVDTNNGGTTPTGSVSPTSSATFSASLLGFDLPSKTVTEPTGFTYDESTTFTFDVPPIPISFFSVSGGITATAGVQITGALAINGFQLTAAPQASIGAHIFGGVNLGIASGGVNVTIQLIGITIPMSASATLAVSTEPAVCAATFQATIDGSVKITSGGGSVDLVGTLGVCPFCIEGSLNIFHWRGRDLGTVPFPAPFPIQVPGDLFPLPVELCRLPLVVNILTPKPTTAILVGIPQPTGADARRSPLRGQILGSAVGCEFVTWTSSNPSVTTFSPSAVGCNPQVTFSAAAAGTSQTLTATAVDQFGETGSASVTVNVAAVPAGPVPRITTPIDGSSSGGGYFLDGFITGGTGTVTAVWRFDGVIVDTQTVAAGTNVVLAERLFSNSANGEHTVTLTATDGNGLTNTDTVVVITVIVR